MKKYVKIILSSIIILMITCTLEISNAASPTQADIQRFIDEHSSINPENITKEDVVDIYEELSDQYTNEELADVLNQYSEELEQAGVNKDVVDTGEAILRTTDQKDLKNILENTDINEIKAEIENVAEKSDSENTSNSIFPSKTIGFTIQVLLANKTVRAALFVSLIAIIILVIYMAIVRWKIYKKAGKHGWAAIVPIYRDIVWLNIAGISPWVLLLGLLPIIGWLILGVIFIVSKFTLPKEFGRSAGWGLGMWLVPVIFESIVAFSSGFEYKKFK